MGNYEAIFKIAVSVANLLKITVTSVIKGFKLETTDAMNVVSKLTAIDQNAAVSAGQIATALQTVATSAQQAGLGLDETMAYISTIADVTQREASVVGTSLRTIISRYGNVKAGKFSNMNTTLGSEEDDTESLNDIEKVLKKIGISIRSSTMEFRDMDEVLQELSEKWITLGSVERNAIKCGRRN